MQRARNDAGKQPIYHRAAGSRRSSTVLRVGVVTLIALSALASNAQADPFDPVPMNGVYAFHDSGAGGAYLQFGPSPSPLEQKVYVPAGGLTGP